MKELAAALARTEKMLEDLGREDQITYATIVWRKYGGDPLKASTGASTAPSNGLQAAALHASVSSFFLQFWSEYPRRQGKQEALLKYVKLKPNQELQDRILEAVRQQKTWEAWTREDGRFIPLPSTWLHQRRWDDEVTTSNAPLKPPSLSRRLLIEGSLDAQS